MTKTTPQANLWVKHRLCLKEARHEADSFELAEWSERLTPGQLGWLGATAVGSIPALALSLFLQRLYFLLLLQRLCLKKSRSPTSNFFFAIQNYVLVAVASTPSWVGTLLQLQFGIVKWRSVLFRPCCRNSSTIGAVRLGIQTCNSIEAILGLPPCSIPEMTVLYWVSVSCEFWHVLRGPVTESEHLPCLVILAINQINQKKMSIICFLIPGSAWIDLCQECVEEAQGVWF